MKDAPLSRPQAATELAMQVHLQTGTNEFTGQWYIGPLAVRPSSEAETILLPDHMYLASEHDECRSEYYLAGAPDWILDAPCPGSLSFWREIKLPRYIQGGAQEVWLLDWQRRHVDVFIVSNERPVRAGRYGRGDRINSDYFPDLVLDPTESFRRGSRLIRDTENSADRPQPRSGRRASPQPEPQRLDVDRLNAWRPAAWHKLEIVEGTVYGAGTREETYRTLAVFLAACGLTAAVALAPPAHWRAALDRLQPARS